MTPFLFNFIITTGDSMSKPTHSQLQRQVEILVANGQTAPIQTIMAGIGYPPDSLATGQSLLQRWLSHKTKAQALLATQKQTTQAGEAARQAAQTELSSLSQTVRVLFGADQAVLTSLGLLPRRSSVNGVEAPLNGNSNGNGNGHHASQPSSSIAETIARWRLLLANLQTLSKKQQARLTDAGWSAERQAAAASLVEAYAVANNSQKQKIQTYRAESAAAQTAEITLRQWYSQVTRLARLAIKKADPNNKEQLQGLLGM
jgi:hypothetical protein